MKHPRFKLHFQLAIRGLNFCLAFLPTVYADSVTDSDSIVNERIPIKAKALEDHWQVNCELVYEQALSYLKNDTRNPKTHQQIVDDLEKCGYIYNVTGSFHYQAEPNYLLLRQDIENSKN